MHPGRRFPHREVTRPKEVCMLVTNPLAPKSWSRELVRSVSSGWWVLLLSGIVSIVAGGIILLVDWSLNDLAVFLGVIFIVRGVFNMMSLPLDGSMRGWAVVLGLLEVGVGIAVLAWPEPTLLVIAAFIGWWILFSGVMTVAGSISGRRILPYWGLFLALGILEMVVGVWLLYRPGLTLLATVFAIGLWAILYGIVLTAASIELKNLPDRLDELERQVTNPPLTEPRPVTARAG
jgi:uncharacterized membrane protein HdeD (DUF308 family)